VRSDTQTAQDEKGNLYSAAKFKILAVWMIEALVEDQ
jgi:hypothetical protein